MGVGIEMMLTASLVLAVLMLANEKHVAGPFAAVRFLPFPCADQNTHSCP